MQSSKWVTLIFGALCLMAVAGVLNAQNLYYMAAILLTLPGVSYIFGWHSLRGLTFQRELPATAWEGEIGEITYSVQNPTRIPRFFLSVQELLPNWLEIADDTPTLFNVGAYETIEVSYRVRFLRRGVFQVTAFEANAMDPLGVFAFGRLIECTGELVVYPRPLPLSDLAVGGAERFGWQSLLVSIFRGSGIDPDGVRCYVTGDPLRRIHWRQTARTGKLSVIEFEEPHTLNLHILLDSGGAGAKAALALDVRIRAAAAAAQVALNQGATVGLATGSEVIGRAHTSASLPGRGSGHLYTLLDRLARVEPSPPTSLSAFVEESATHLPPGTTLLLVTSEPDIQLIDTVAHMVAQGASLVVFFVTPSTQTEQATRRGGEFRAGLLAAGARVLLLNYEADGETYPGLQDYAGAA